MLGLLHKGKNWLTGRRADLIAIGLSESEQVEILPNGKMALPKFGQLKTVSQFLSPREKKIIKISAWIAAACLIIIGVKFYYGHSAILPKAGGAYTEGLVGTPQYINPVIASYNDVDRDLTALIFNGLLKINNEGVLEPDLAESYEISPDRKSYLFTLKQNIVWHDGQPFNADDVIFTITSIQDPEWQSQLKSVLDSVQAEKLGDFQLKLTLKEPIVNFASSLTFGIIPAHLWQTIPARNTSLAELNKKPVGTGPYKFKSLTKDKSGTIRTMTLEANAEYFKQPAYIKELIFKFYGDVQTAADALANRHIEGMSFVQKEFYDKLKKERQLAFYSLSLPQYTAVFFNTKNNVVLKDKTVRQALALAIDKQKILDVALDQKGVLISGPILPGYLGFSPDLKKYGYQPDEAKKLLEANGWKKGNDNIWQKGQQKLSIALMTVEKTEYQKAAEVIQQNWKDIGVDATLEIISKDRIIPDVIEPRAYQALLYGQIMKSDPYPLWHSSQNASPGYNLAVWSNYDIDKLLEEARVTEDLNQVNQKYLKFQEILAENEPTIFLYNPIQTYPVDSKIKGLATRRINTPADRFTDITSWYIKTDRKFSLRKN